VVATVEMTLFTTFSRTEPRNRAQVGLPADGRAPRGFTLTELLAVLAIVLIIVAGSVSVWLALAGAVAPGHATAVVQAMLAGAREYAVSKGVMTRVVFENSLANVDRGTTMYYEAWDQVTSSWKRIPGRASQDAGKQVFVLTGAPDLSSKPVPDVAANAENPDASDVKLWQEYRDWVAGEVAEYAFTNVNAAGYLEANAAFKTGQSGQDKFYVTFDSAGTLSLDASVANPLSLTVIQIGGTGRRVSEYEFYLLNANTGAPLVFE
jgi:prepilin-type N-terminal cleavage/methylation domain-containing protein